MDIPESVAWKEPAPKHRKLSIVLGLVLVLAIALVCSAAAFVYYSLTQQDEPVISETNEESVTVEEVEVPTGEVPTVEPPAVEEKETRLSTPPTYTTTLSDEEKRRRLRSE